MERLATYQIGTNKHILKSDLYQPCLNVHNTIINTSRYYNAFNVYRRELAPGTVSLTGDRAQGDDSKHWAYSTLVNFSCLGTGKTVVVNRYFGKQ